MRRMLGWCAAAALLALALGLTAAHRVPAAQKRRVCAECALRAASNGSVARPAAWSGGRQFRGRGRAGYPAGVGEVIAQRIIEEREENGPFYYPEDLMNVKGIGEKTLEKLLSHIRLP